MDQGKRGSLLAEGRDEMTDGFNPLLLWRDRRRILAQPEIAAAPRPPLANSPLRYALALSLTPLLLVAWLTSLLVDLTPRALIEPGPIEARSAVTIEVLGAELPGLDREQTKVLARSIRRKDMVPEAQPLAESARQILSWEPFMPAAERRAAMRDWVARVRASPLTAPHQDVLIAQLLHVAHVTRPADRLNGNLLRSIAEGGTVMQVLSVVSLLLGAWLFGQTLRSDARFQHAARADRFYLYYTTSRIFWFLPAQTLAYGIGSYASATADVAMFDSASRLSMLISLASVLYLLAGAGIMARALAGSPPAPPPHAAWSIGWRLVVSMLTSLLVVMVLGMLLAVLLGIGAILLG